MDTDPETLHGRLDGLREALAIVFGKKRDLMAPVDGRMSELDARRHGVFALQEVSELIERASMPPGSVARGVHEEVERLRASVRALYRHASGESVGGDALDAAMCHGREIDEAATAAEASDDNG